MFRPLHSDRYRHDLVISLTSVVVACISFVGAAQAPSMPTKSVAMEACEQELHLLRQCVNKCTELSGFRSARVLSALISLCSRCGANNIVPSTSGRQATARLASSSCAPPRDISASAALILSCVMGDDECQRQAIEIQSTHSGGDGLKVP